MTPLSALSSVVQDAVFHADAAGRVLEANAPFVQLMRCMAGDDWRLTVDVGDRALDRKSVV